MASSASGTPPNATSRLAHAGRSAQHITAVADTHFVAPACAISRGSQVPAGTCRQLLKVAALTFEKIHTELVKYADFNRVDLFGES